MAQYLDLKETEKKWRREARLQAPGRIECSVKVSPVEMVIVGGDHGQPSEAIKQNVITGEKRKLKSPPFKVEAQSSPGNI